MKKIRLYEIFLVSMQIGFTAFGGGAAMMSYVRKIVVVDKEWISNDTFDQMAVVSNILPGPVIVQLLALIHYKTRGIRGVIASLFPIIFVLPFLFVMSVSLFEAFIPQALIHKITLVLIPFILILTSEYIVTLCQSQIKKNKTKADWLFTFVLTLLSCTLLYFGLSTTVVIFVYLSVVICYATALFYRGGKKNEY